MNNIVSFQGRRYNAVPVSADNRVRVTSSIPKLDHLGSLRDQLQPQCSGFQVYDAGESKVAAACSANSQFINVVYWLHPYIITPL